MIKISVVVPVYNAERYLIKCVNSIMNQSFKEKYELILVNDGSEDHSEDIINKKIDEFGSDRIVKVNQKNGGQGKARNAGVRVARGEYIIFVDSDDYIDKEMLKDLYERAIQEKSDLVICDYIEEIEENKIYKKSLYKELEDINKEYILTVAGPCSKLIKRSLIEENDLYFPENMIYEDLAIMPTLGAFASKITYIKKPYYYYYIRNNSSMRQIEYNSKLKDIFKAMELLEKKLIDTDLKEKYLEELEFLYIQHLLYAGTGRFINFKEGSDDIKRIHDIMIEKFPNWKKNKYYLKCSKIYKITCNMFWNNNKLLIDLYKKVRKNGKR